MSENYVELAIRVKDALAEMGFGVANGSYVRIDEASQSDVYFNILTPVPEVEPVTGIMKIFGQPRPRSQVIGKLTFKERMVMTLGNGLSTWVIEVMGRDLVETAETIARELDRRFGKIGEGKTVVCLTTESHQNEVFNSND